MSRVRRIREEEGAALVELALTIPVVLLLVYGIIYYGLVLTVQGILQNATARALEVAVTLPEFQNPPPQGGCSSTDSAEGSEFCDGVDKVKQILLSLPYSTIVSSSPQEGFAYITADEDNPQIVFPAVDGATDPASWSEALQSKPIEIKVKAYVQAFLPWMKPVAISVSNVGYYEVTQVRGYPVMVDCNGLPQGHPNYGKLPCDCSQYPNAVWDPQTLSCYTCQEDTSATLDSDHSPTSQTPKGCYCPTHDYCRSRYGLGAQTLWDIRSERYCWCGCYGGAGWDYQDSQNQEVSSGCVCKDVPAPYDPDGEGGQPPHVFASRTVNEAENTCECNPPVTIDECRAWFPLADQNGMLTVQRDKCACACAPCPDWDTMRRADGGLAAGCACECIDSNKVYKEEEGRCVCDDPNDELCPGPAVPDPDDCTKCICDPNGFQPCGFGGVRRAPDCQCDCPCSNPSNPTECIECPQHGGSG